MFLNMLPPLLVTTPDPSNPGTQGITLLLTLGAFITRMSYGLMQPDSTLI